MRDDGPRPDDERESATVVEATTATSGSASARASAKLNRLIAKAEVAAEPLVENVKGGVTALEAAVSGLRGLELPGGRVRRVRRLGREPLASLPELYPEARQGRPVDVGIRTIDVNDIRGTAVGGGDQRGGDFLPLKPFRGLNWNARWQRLRQAQAAMALLPPIDVVRYEGSYWVRDGHNRVALAKYTGQQDIDADVVEIVRAGGRRTEPIGSLAATVEEGRPVRARVERTGP